MLGNKGQTEERLNRDVFAGLRDLVGGRSAGYEEKLAKAEDIAVEEVVNRAAALGDNAVVGVDLDYESIIVGSSGSMLMISGSGTAAIVE